MINWMTGEVIMNPTQIIVVAPPGKLGIIVDTSSEGPIVHSVKNKSPLHGLIFVGDLIVYLDDEDTTDWTAQYLTKLVAKRSMVTRKFTVLRTDVIDDECLLINDKCLCSL